MYSDRDGVVALERTESCRKDSEVKVAVDVVAVAELVEECVGVDSRAHECSELVLASGLSLVEEGVYAHI